MEEKAREVLKEGKENKREDKEEGRRGGGRISVISLL